MDWNKEDNLGQTPLYWALNNKNSDIVDIVDEGGWSLVFRTIERKKLGEKITTWIKHDL